jgi:hypothetical protein
MNKLYPEINNVEEEFNKDKLNEIFKPVYEIINDDNKSLQRKLQLIHNMIVDMRNHYDPLQYFGNIKERNKELNRLKYQRKKKQEKLSKPIEQLTEAKDNNRTDDDL